jgi:hypothetical protein
MNLYEMLASAQGGNNLQALGAQYGLTPQQTLAVVDALMPAFSQGFRRTTSDPNGLGALLQALATGGHAQYAQDPMQAFSPQGIADGNGILGHLFGSKDLSRAVAQQASAATGVDAATLRHMLPPLAAMVMGGMFQQTAGQAQAAQAGGFGAGDGNILGDIIKEMMKQGGQQRAPQPRQAPQREGSDNPLGQILKDVFGGGQSQQPRSRQPMPEPDSGQYDRPAGNPLEQILKDMLGGGQAQPPQSRQPRGRQPDAGGNNPFGDNPLGKIFEEMMRGGQPQGVDPTMDHEERAGRAGRAPQGRRQQQRNPYDDVFGQLRESGSRQSQEYQRGVEDIFEQYKRGMDRFR